MAVIMRHENQYQCDSEGMMARGNDACTAVDYFYDLSTNVDGNA